MSDDEQEPEAQDVEEEVTSHREEHVEAAPKPKLEQRPKIPAASIDHDDGKPEAEIRMEMERKKRKEKAEEEWKEYEEMRKVEREKEEQEIRELREKKESRKIERADQEKRLAELRAMENEKKRAEEEERQRRKREEEQKKKEERDKKNHEAEERNKKMGKPNFVVTKKEGGSEPAGGSAEKTVSTAPQKTKEQLESEKRAVLEQRVQALKIDGFNQQQLAEKAKDLYQQIFHLEGEKYDLEQRFKRQQCDIVELAERARQMAKGGGKQKSNLVAAPDTDNVGGIPMQPKVVMYSQYERVKDHRSFGEKQVVFSGPTYKEEYIRIVPEKRITMTEQGAKVDGLIEGDHTNHAPAAAEA